MLWMMISSVLGMFLLLNEIAYFRNGVAILKFRKIAILLFIIAICYIPTYLEIKVFWISTWLAIWLIIIAFFRKTIFSTIVIILIAVMCSFIGCASSEIIYNFYQLREITEDIQIINLECKEDVYILQKDITFEECENQTMNVYIYYPVGISTSENCFVPVKDTRITYVEEGEKAYLEIIEKKKVTFDFRKPEEIKESEFIGYEYILHIPQGSIKRGN